MSRPPDAQIVLIHKIQAAACDEPCGCLDFVVKFFGLLILLGSRHFVQSITAL